MRPSARTLLLVLFFLGAPAVVTAFFLASRSHVEAQDGDQPGGVITATLRAAEDAPAGLGFELEPVVLFVAEPEGEVREVARTRADHAGRFELTAPPARGHYEIQAGGVAWIAARTAHSLAPGATARPPDLALKPAARLVVDVRCARGRAPSGDWSVDASLAETWLASFATPRPLQNGAFTDGHVEIDGLPPLRVRLLMQLASGERIELVIDLAVGANRHVVDV